MAVSEEDLQKVLQIFQNSENKEELLQFVMAHYPQLILRSPAHRDVALLDGSKFFRLILGAMEYAIFPHARSPALSHLVGITTRQSSWHWAVNQIRVHVPDPTWVHAANLALLSKVFAKMFFSMGRCKFPLYITSKMAEEWFEIWRIVNEVRMSRNAWTFLGMDCDEISPELLAFRQLVQRNQEKAKENHRQIEASPNKSVE